MALRAEYDRALREAPSAFFSRVLARPPCSSVVEKLASSLTTGSQMPASLGIGRPTRRRLRLTSGRKNGSCRKLPHINVSSAF